MSHLGVELHGVELLFGVFHCGDGAVPAACGHTEAGRYFVYIIRMAHPAGCRFADIAAEQKRAFIDSDINLTEFAAARFDDTAEGVRHKLCAVAYAEDRDAELKKRLVVCHGIFAVHTFRTACQDYALIACRFDLLKRRSVWADFRIYVVFSDATGDKLIILPAEVKHEDLFHALYLSPAK